MFVLVLSMAYEFTTKEAKYVDIRKVRELKFHKDRNTNGRAQAPGPQMRPQKVDYQPDVITCKSESVFGRSPRWQCKASEAGVDITEYTIECEGRDGDSDNFVLEGSCSILYDAVFSDNKKYQKYTESPKYQKYDSYFSNYRNFFDNGVYRRNKNLSPINVNDISVLVFEKDEKTESKKGEFYPQMMAKSGNQFEPDQIVCRNLGSDGQMPVWKCRAHLDYPLQFKEAHVSCEGWSGPGDSMIVPGSCLVEYKIQEPQNSGNIPILYIILFICLLLFIIGKCSKAPANARPQPPPQQPQPQIPQRQEPLNQPYQRNEPQYHQKVHFQQPYQQPYQQPPIFVPVPQYIPVPQFVPVQPRFQQPVFQRAPVIHVHEEPIFVRSGNEEKETKAEKEKRESVVAKTSTR
ncbi:SOCE-associated_regulatory factor of calcium homoeostasis [Hexamita inflata]|uniref:Store-operated calcium entry-associated regulatory factor n=1 Tax=Hexamita inflata TaxID=28002 RepID=A0AA86PLN1_9EUKA|nr:SOCE-associated regulatory factor of calcium homoeostasis [Hexamita inflata]